MMKTTLSRLFGASPAAVQVRRGGRCLARLQTVSLASSLRLFSLTAALHRRIDVVVPQMAESISEGTLTTIQKRIGENVDADEEIATIETDKIDVTVSTAVGGRVVALHVNENDVVVVGQAIATLETGRDDAADEAPCTPTEDLQKVDAAESESAGFDATKKPLAEPASTPETVEHDMHTPEPSVKEVKPNNRSTERPSAAPPSEENAPSVRPQSRSERVEKMPRIRQTIARRLKESQNRTASLTTVQRIDMTSLMAWRAQNKETVMRTHGVRLGYMGAFTKAATLAALAIPQVNASMDMEKQIIKYRDYVDVSIAVSTPKGLVTPVLRNTESMNVIDIERGVAAIAEKARTNMLTLADLEGGNFSISNPGIFGSMFGTPLINYPQSAVFNMNSISEEPAVVDGQIVIRPLMYITLTYDHRLIDGREAVGFLNKVKGYIEDPSSMLLLSGSIDP